MKPRPEPTLFDLQKLVVDLAHVNRNHRLAGHKRQENDIEHSFAVALLCWFICTKFDLGLNLEKVLKYAMAHDFVELYAGDVNSFASPAERTKKAADEKASLEQMSQELADFGDLVKIMKDYELKADEEALFVWTVDKMQAYIMGDLDNWRPYKKLEISYDRFIDKHKEQLAACSPYCKEIFETLLEYCKSTYYDRPAASQA